MTDGQPDLASPVSDADWAVPAFDARVAFARRHAHALVIPVINEGERIRGQLLRVRDAGLPVDVVVADGGSTDGSLDDDFVQPAGVRAVLTKTGPGRLSAQLRMAYAWCLREGYHGIVTMDGNGKDGVEAVAGMVAALEAGHDYVQGSRYLRGGLAENTPLDRTIGGRLIHAPVLSAASGRWYTDTTNGFRAYSRRYLLDPAVAPFRDIFQNYNLLFYLTARAGQLGYHTTEVPVRRSYPLEGSTPTKIAGMRGRIDMLGELFGAACGGCQPAGPAPLGPPGTAAGTRAVRALLAVTVALLVLTRLLPFGYGLDPGTDEAMLLANLPLPSLGAMVSPLPLFEQAAPLGYLALVHSFASWITDPLRLTVALRVVSVVAGLASLAAMLRAIHGRANHAIAALALCFGGLTPFAIAYAFEIKHYIVEHLAMSLLLATAATAAAAPGPRALAAYGLAGVASILSAFTAPLAIAATTAGLVAQRAVQADRPLTRPWLLTLGGTVAALGALFVAYYLGYAKPVTTFQFAGYAHLYDKAMVSLVPGRSWVRLPNLLSEQLWVAGTTGMAWNVTFALLVLAGLLASVRAFVLLPVTFVTGGALVHVLSMAGVLPVLSARHFAFLAPVLALVAAYGAFAIVRAVAWRLAPGHSATLVTGLCGAVTLAVGGVALTRSDDDLGKPQVTPLLAQMQTEPTRPVWVYYGAQPAMRVLAPPSLTQLGLISHDSQVPGWVWAPRNLPDLDTSDATYDTFARTIRGHGPLWLVFTHFDGEPDGLARFRTLAEAELGGCEETVHASGSVLWRCG